SGARRRVDWKLQICSYSELLPAPCDGCETCCSCDSFPHTSEQRDVSPNRSRFVTACQQMLVLGVVLAALTPAAGVVTLDVVGTGPPTIGGTSARPTAALAAYTAEAVQASKVPTAPVKPHVREVRLT